MQIAEWMEDRHQRGGDALRVRPMLSAGVPRGGDGAGTLLAETRAAEAVDEARAIVDAVEPQDAHAYHVDSGDYANDGTLGGTAAILADMLAAFDAAEDPAEWLRERQE